MVLHVLASNRDFVRDSHVASADMQRSTHVPFVLLGIHVHADICACATSLLIHVSFLTSDKEIKRKITVLTG
jgi:hypothetical protein